MTGRSVTGRGVTARLAFGAALLVALGVAVPALADPPTPAGVWRTFSDKDGHESGRVEIVDRGGLLFGRIVAIVDPAKRDAVCAKCTDDRRGQKVLGLEILRHLKRDGDRWDGGEILDPEPGSTYRCSMRLENGGQTLVVRGFIGMAMFGRTQRWQRAG